MQSKLLIAFTFLALLACSDDSSNPTYPFERTVLDVSIAKRCKDGSFAPGANCYLMRWSHPIEKKDLHSYYVWLDTIAVKDSIQKVSQAQIDQAAATIPYSNRNEGDSLDLTDLISQYLERDSLHIAIWAKYSGDDQGVVQHIYVHFGDDVRPSVVSFSDSASANTIWINWIRPTDQRDFYFPDVINGPIAGYNVSIKAEANEDIRGLSVYASLAGGSVNSNLLFFQRFNKDGRGVKLEEVSKSDPKFLRLAILDGKSFNDDDNNWKMEIQGLKPEYSYSITITAYDSSGNSSSEESRSVKTTDNRAPSIANKFWLYLDSGDSLPSLDSNRLILFWPRSLDTLDDKRLVDVQGYSIEQLNGKAWEAIPRVSAVRSGYYNAKYELENDSMKLADNGSYVSDTLRWILPGDTVILRIRAIDSSGHYSKAWIDTIVVSKGALWQYACPQNFAPVKMDSTVFCMEKLQHGSNGKFEKNVLYIEAKNSCEAQGYRLCSENEWNAACHSRGSSYGIIEEKNEDGIFSPDQFLYLNCGVGTGDSLSAVNAAKRNKICASPDGIRDLPGQLQEWVIGKGDSALLKGSSYAIFEGASRVELAQCRNRFTPTRIRPKYTTDSVYLYRTGSRIDTLLIRDSLRTVYAVLSLKDFKDTLLFYSLKSSSGELLGEDYVNQAEYRRRGDTLWLKALWQGLQYEFKEPPKQVLILGDTTVNASDFFLDPTVGFRCCANTN
ncbi:MAG: hypothetical protein FWC26_10770 [Fibromonadales bacterium]|nr:hypothetical protein [Fibromonadales bacterium]